MRVILAKKIQDTIAELFIRANLFLRGDVVACLKAAYKKEKHKRAKNILSAIIKNASIAAREKLAICQDTGIPLVLLEIGQEARIDGDLKKAINSGVELGYRRGYLRNSLVKDPLLRGRPGYQPAISYIDLVKGNKIKITVLPKGSGCENKTQLKMFKPTAGLGEIKKFIIDAVKAAGPDACPPFVVGVGMGGSADYAGILAKKALLRKLNAKRHTLYAKLEADLLKAINKLNIGPMGLGGKVTALAVNIESYPTHIVCLPVCVNISCHALRSAQKII